MRQSARTLWLHLNREQGHFSALLRVPEQTEQRAAPANFSKSKAEIFKQKPSAGDEVEDLD